MKKYIQKMKEKLLKENVDEINSHYDKYHSDLK